jgi:hypothetical protein
MADTSYEFLIKFFVNYLPFTPTAGQVDVFKQDLSLVSPYLIEASLVELKNGALGKKLSEGKDWRPAIFQIYNRKVAEHAKLFPVFHSFETAFRSTVAVSLEEYYGEKIWWKFIDAKLRVGKDPREITFIGRRKITRDTRRRIGHTEALEQHRLSGQRSWIRDLARHRHVAAAVAAVENVGILPRELGLASAAASIDQAQLVTWADGDRDEVPPEAVVSGFLEASWTDLPLRPVELVGPDGDAADRHRGDVARLGVVEGSFGPGFPWEFDRRIVREQFLGAPDRAREPRQGGLRDILASLKFMQWAQPQKDSQRRESWLETP